MSDRVADFHVLSSRVRLSGEIVTRTAIRIGSGGGGQQDAMDLPVLRDGDELPFIPGASLKGVLRSTVESLVRAVSDRATSERTKSGLWACDPLLTDKNAPEGERACGWHEPEKRKEVDPEKHCALCRLFGSHVLASHVRISDAFLLRQVDDPIPVEVRDGVAIDRDLRVVHGAQKYDFEVVSPGARFDLELFIENPKPWLMGLLLVGLDQLHDGFTALGGFTSRGLGRVELSWRQVREVTAEGLLTGAPPVDLSDDPLKAQFTKWREALAGRVRGN